MASAFERMSEERTPIGEHPAQSSPHVEAVAELWRRIEKVAGEVTEHTASCRCGQLRATASGDPVRVSVCHCLACQKRTGSAFAVQARWQAECVEIEGRSASWTRTADSGQTDYLPLLPALWLDGSLRAAATLPDVIAIPLGAFDDPYFASPDYSVWEQRKHEWVDILGDCVEHSD